MFIDFNKAVELSDAVTVLGDSTFMSSRKGLKYVRYKNVQLILFHTSDTIRHKHYNYAHLSFKHHRLKLEYATNYFLFKLGTEIQIPRFVSSVLSKDEEKFLSSIREFIKGYNNGE